jgi:hypothetical protein
VIESRRPPASVQSLGAIIREPSRARERAGASGREGEETLGASSSDGCRVSRSCSEKSFALESRESEVCGSDARRTATEELADALANGDAVGVGFELCDGGEGHGVEVADHIFQFMN